MLGDGYFSHVTPPPLPPLPLLQDSYLNLIFLDNSISNPAEYQRENSLQFSSSDNWTKQIILKMDYLLIKTITESGKNTALYSISNNASEFTEVI